MFECFCFNHGLTHISWLFFYKKQGYSNTIKCKNGVTVKAQMAATEDMLKTMKKVVKEL
ncbi:MAG: hypothetical protein ACOWWR_18410 [Eubacteriales bacterium]